MGVNREIWGLKGLIRFIMVNRLVIVVVRIMFVFSIYVYVLCCCCSVVLWGCLCVCVCVFCLGVGFVVFVHFVFDARGNCATRLGLCGRAHFCRLSGST